MLYHNRLKQNIEQNPILETDGVNTAWSKIKANMVEAAEEAMGKRKVTSKATQKYTPWFNEEVKELGTRKKKAYIQYRSTRNQADRDIYIHERNFVNRRIRQIEEEYWEAFTKDMERTLYGSQKKVWRMLRNRKCEINDTIRINKIEESKWK